MPALTDPNSPYVGRRGAAAPNGGTSTGTGTSSGGTTTTRPAAPTIDWAGLVNLLNTPIDYAALGKIASTRAASETGSLVAGYQGLQKSALDQAARYAAQQNQAGLAASKYLGGLNLGGAVAGDYANAAAAQRAAAAGYSGGLQQTVDETAARVQHSLEAAGSPQTALNQGAAAGNALYGLGGNLPALQLDAIGPAVAAGLRAQPAQLLGYAQTMAAGQLAKGQETAAGYADEIATARAKQGALAAKYLDTLSQRAAAAGQDRISTLLKIASLQQKQSAATTQAGQINVGASKLLGHVVLNDGTEPVDAKGNTIPIAAAGAKASYYDDSFGRRIRINPDGSQTVLSAGSYTDPSTGALVQVGIDGKRTPITGGKPVTPPTPHYTTITDATGTYLINENTLTKTKVGGPPASATAGSSYQDVFGRQIKINADGTQTVMSTGTFTDPATQKVFKVGLNGTMTPITKGKKPKPGGPKPPSISDIASLQDDIETWHSGVTGTSNGQPVIDPNSQLSWTQAVARASQRVGRAKALKLVNAVYGTPQKIAAGVVNGLKGGGADLPAAIATMREASTLAVPLTYYIQAIARAYGVSVVRVANMLRGVTGAPADLVGPIGTRGTGSTAEPLPGLTGPVG